MKLLITGAWSQARELIPRIEEMGHEVIFMQQEKESLPCDPKEIEGIICNGLFLHHSIEQFTNLRYIQLISAGFDRVPMEYVKSHNIDIYNARSVYSIPMAEFAIAEVLNVYKYFNEFRAQQEQHEWQKHRDLKELNGKTVIILGCGSVGTECAMRFKAFGCRVIGVDLLQREDDAFDSIKPITELDEQINCADILLLTLPLTEETKGLINEERLQRLKEDAILLNVSRGAIIDTKALEFWHGYAILDVFEEEPLSLDSFLWDREKTIITPHNSFIAEGNGYRLSNLIICNLERLNKNEFGYAQG